MTEITVQFAFGTLVSSVFLLNFLSLLRVRSTIFVERVALGNMKLFKIKILVNVIDEYCTYDIKPSYIFSVSVV